MNEKDNGGPAFPWPVPAPHQAYTGMTLRDYFAAKAMQSFLYQPEWESMPVEHVAAWAYEQADAMLKAREA